MSVRVFFFFFVLTLVALIVAERAAAHYMRLKWVAARLSVTFVQGPSVSLLQPIRKSIGLALTLTEMETALATEQTKRNDWRQ